MIGSQWNLSSEGPAPGLKPGLTAKSDSSYPPDRLRRRVVMGLFGRKIPRGERREPSLFGTRVPSRRPGRPRQRRRPILWRAASFVFRLGLIGAVIAGLGFGYIWMSLDKKGLFQVPEREPGMMLLAADGSILQERGAFFGDEARIAELPAYVPKAVIAIEDRRFRSHFGVDPIGLVRAVSKISGRRTSCRAARR